MLKARRPHSAIQEADPAVLPNLIHTQEAELPADAIARADRWALTRCAHGLFTAVTDRLLIAGRADMRPEIMYARPDSADSSVPLVQIWLPFINGLTTALRYPAPGGTITRWATPGEGAMDSTRSRDFLRQLEVVAAERDVNPSAVTQEMTGAMHEAYYPLRRELIEPASIAMMSSVMVDAGLSVLCGSFGIPDERRLRASMASR